MEYTVTLGDLIQAGVVLCAVFGAWANIRIEQARLEERQDGLEKRLDSHETSTSTVLTEIKTNIKNGFDRVYDKLDGKADR